MEFKLKRHNFIPRRKKTREEEEWLEKVMRQQERKRLRRLQHGTPRPLFRIRTLSEGNG